MVKEEERVVHGTIHHPSPTSLPSMPRELRAGLIPRDTVLAIFQLSSMSKLPLVRFYSLRSSSDTTISLPSILSQLSIEQIELHSPSFLLIFLTFLTSLQQHTYTTPASLTHPHSLLLKPGGSKQGWPPPLQRHVHPPQGRPSPPPPATSLTSTNASLPLQVTSTNRQTLPPTASRSSLSSNGSPPSSASSNGAVTYVTPLLFLVSGLFHSL